MNEPASAAKADRAEAAFIRFLRRPRLALGLAAVAVLLGSPSLFLGHHLDEIVGQYIYSDLEGAARLYRVYQGGYAIANGNPADTAWQIEQGFAPWWTYPGLLVRMSRPLSQALHDLDFAVVGDSSVWMHAHNLLWMAALALATTRLFRGVLGPLVGGLAALLFAVDHTHGFVVGYWANRHALITAVFGVLALDTHIRARASGSVGGAILATALYGLSLLAGESGISIAGYLFAYTAFADKGPLSRRILSFLPYVLLTLVWRALYNRAGYGAHGSGLYIDPIREPLRFLPALFERGPILVLGQFLAPPAELYTIGSAWISRAMLVFALLFMAALVVALLPLLKREPVARFWTAGMVLSLVPAAATYPHNRQLLFSSFGAMALVAQLWQLHALELKGTTPPRLVQASGIVGAIVLFGHLLVSPLASPVMTCSVLAATALESGVDDVGNDAAGKDAVFMTAPDYFAVKLIQFKKRVERSPLPRKWRALSFGPQPVTVRRPDERTLRLDYEGGILQSPFMQLYRDARIPMVPGDRVELEGLRITVRAVTPDGRAKTADFEFDRPLGAPSFRFYAWNGEGFSPFTPPAVGAEAALPGATVPWGVK